MAQEQTSTTGFHHSSTGPAQRTRVRRSCCLTSHPCAGFVFTCSVPVTKPAVRCDTGICRDTQHGLNGEGIISSFFKVKEDHAKGGPHRRYFHRCGGGQSTIASQELWLCNSCDQPPRGLFRGIMWLGSAQGDTSRGLLEYLIMFFLLLERDTHLKRLHMVSF